MSALLRHLLRRTTTTTTSLLHPLPTLQTRTLAFSSAEEAAAERRRRKRRLRIEPPLHALRHSPSHPRPPPDPNSKPLPDTTSSLTGPRLSLHNRVQSLIRAGDLPHASLIARQSLFSRTRPTVFTCNALIAAFYRHSLFSHAASLFHFFFTQSGIVPNVVSYNFLILSHVDSRRLDLALHAYNALLSETSFGPSSITYRHLTKGLVEDGRITDAVAMLREMLNKGLGADSMVYNNIIKGFLDEGNFDKAVEFFDELKERCLVYDGVVNATFMEWFFKQGKGKEAMESYRELLDRKFRMTPATCNVLLEVLIRHGRKKEARELFETMLDNHTPPNFQAVNSETFSIMVNECFKEGRFEEAVETFRKVGTKMGSRPFAMDVAGYNNIVVRFAESGMTAEAEKFFAELQSKSLSPDVTGYRTLIDAFLKEERSDDAVGMFNKMVDANLRVISEYANRWFTELIGKGKVVECSQLLTKMGERDPKPDAFTYEIVIKGLCGVEEFDVAVDLVGQVMRYCVGVTPSFKEYLLEVFEKEGRKEEMEKLLDERRQGYWQQSSYSQQSSGPPPRPGGLGQYPRSAGPDGYRAAGASSGFSGGTGYSGPAGQTGYTNSAGPTGYPGAPGPTGNTNSAGQTGYTNSAGPTGYTNSAGPTGYTNSAGPTGYTNPSGPSGYTGAAGPSGYAVQTGPSGYPGAARQTSYPGPTGYSGAAGPTGVTERVSSTRYSVPAGNSTYPGSAGSTWNAESNGYPEQRGYQAQGQYEQYPRFEGVPGTAGFVEPARPAENGGFQGPVTPPTYSGGPGPEHMGQPGPNGPTEQRGRYPGSGYNWLSRITKNNGILRWSRTSSIKFSLEEREERKARMKRKQIDDRAMQITRSLDCDEGPLLKKNKFDDKNKHPSGVQGIFTSTSCRHELESNSLADFFEIVNVSKAKLYQIPLLKGVLC